MYQNRIIKIILLPITAFQVWSAVNIVNDKNRSIQTFKIHVFIYILFYEYVNIYIILFYM